MKKIWIAIFSLFFTTLSRGQTFRHYDYLGAGHQNEVSVTSSSGNAQWTADGFDIQNDEQLKAASRFLAQASFGADWSTIQMTAAMGYDTWLEEQFNLPVGATTPIFQRHSIAFGEEEVDENFGGKHWFKTAWMHSNMTTPDILRQRLGFALSQHFVFSNANSDLFEDFGMVTSNYYDMLLNNAFSNYQTLLTEVSRSPAMGLFLSHFANPKEDLANNIHPDENYAREIMQLFSIGLWELNTNGTRKYDSNGEFIPTYTNADIKEFAQVFTGFGDGTSNGTFQSFDDTEFDPNETLITPMSMYDDYHDRSSKRLLNGIVLPAGQSGLQDFEQTIDHLSTHANTAPFFAKAMIKFLTTSNPSPSYVQRVVNVFNPASPNNLEEVFKAILLDPEARTCTPSATYSFGKLREPITRYMNYLKALPVLPVINGEFLYEMGCLAQETGQVPMESPSVFNFFSPEYSPQGEISQTYRVAPEFQILNSTNAIGIVNRVDEWAIRRIYFGDCVSEWLEPEETEAWEEDYLMDYSTLTPLANHTDALLNRLDILFANGQLSDDTKNIIKNAVNQLDNAEDKLRMAIYLILVSPDYVILK